jgi:hypothetical protein
MEMLQSRKKFRKGFSPRLLNNECILVGRSMKE